MECPFKNSDSIEKAIIVEGTSNQASNSDAGPATESAGSLSATAIGILNPPTELQVEQCPEGLPRLAALLSSDENFMLYRRFGYLSSRLLLYKQDELRLLEDDLDHYDQIDEKHDSSLLRSRERDDILGGGRRKKLLAEIELKFREYADLLVSVRDLAGFNRPPKRDYLSVKSYFDEEKPIVGIEAHIYNREDIITLKPGRETAWLDTQVEKILLMFSCRLIRWMFGTKDQARKADPKTTGLRLCDPERINIAVSLIVTIMILALLIVPVWLLFHLSQRGSSIGIIIVVLLLFTMSFSAMLSLFTRAMRHEILASASAYCAVLVVFIGNIQQWDLSSGSKSTS